MSIVVFAPYGLICHESGLLALLTSYLQQGPYSVTQMLCNGCFSLCDRDADHGWKRGLRTCFSCMKEQSAIAQWAGITTTELSTFILPDTVLESKRWGLKINQASLCEAEFEGQRIYDLVADSFTSRFGVDRPDFQHKGHEETLRRMLVSSVRSMVAFKHYFKQTMCEHFIVSGGSDFITRSALAAARIQKIPSAILRWDINNRAVMVSSSTSDKEYACPLVFENVTTLRTDSRTWPRELTRVLDEILVFLDVAKSQISLPLAQ